MTKTLYLFLLCACFPFLLMATGDEFPVATDQFSQNTPMVVFDGEDYFTMYIDRRGEQYSFYSRFITPDGDVGPEILAVPEHPVMSFMPGLAMGEDNFLFTWSRQRGIWDWDRDGMARLINLDGSPASGIIQVSGPETQDSPAFMRVAFDGEHYLVIWQDGLPGQGARIMGQFVCGTDYNLVGSNFLIRPNDMGTDVSQIYPDILFDGTNYLVVWDDDRSGERSIYGVFLDTAGHPDGEFFTISDNPDRQLLARVAYNGQHYMAVWADRRHGSKNSVYGRRFDQEGDPVGDEISISPLQNNEERSYPRIASNGNQFMVAWEQQLLTKASKDAPSGQTERDLAAGVETRQSVIWYEVHGRRINADGSFDTDEMPIGVANYHQQNPEIAGQEDQFLVLWQDSRVNNQYSDVYGRFIPADAPQELPAPVNLSAEFTGEAIELQWEEPAYASRINLLHYHLYKDDELFVSAIEDTWYADTEFAQDTSYSYHVTAVYDAGESAPSNTAVADIPVMHVQVTFAVKESAALGGDAIPGATVWLEDVGEQQTDEDGLVLFEQVDVMHELSWEVSHGDYFPESGAAMIGEEDMTIDVELVPDDTSIADHSTSQPVQISPNPVSDLLRLQSEQGIRQIRFLDIRGLEYKALDGAGSRTLEVHVGELPAGVYLIYVQMENGEQQVVRIIKQ